MTVHHEINLKIPTLQLAIFISLETLNYADIHAIALFAKLVIDNILHNMSVFYLSEVKNCISDTDVLEVILGACTNIFATFHIIAQCLADNEGIL